MWITYEIQLYFTTFSGNMKYYLRHSMLENEEGQNMEFKGNPSSVVMPNTTFFKVWNDLRKVLLAHFGRMNEVCLKIRLHSIQFTNHHSLSDDIDEYLGHRAFAPEDVNQLNRQEGQLTRQVW